MFATHRDSLLELNQSDLGLLETRLTVLAERLETSLVKKRWDLETSITKNNWDLVKWMFTFFGAYVVWTGTLALLLAETIRR